MFHCGPPDDFRCKFSRHANYSSAVLTTPRQQLKQEVQRQLMAEAAQQASQRHMSQHEQELTNLRSRIASVRYFQNTSDSTSSELSLLYIDNWFQITYSVFFIYNLYCY